MAGTGAGGGAGSVGSSKPPLPAGTRTPRRTDTPGGDKQAPLRGSPDEIGEKVTRPTSAPPAPVSAMAQPLHLGGRMDNIFAKNNLPASGWGAFPRTGAVDKDDIRLQDNYDAFYQSNNGKYAGPCARAEPPLGPALGVQRRCTAGEFPRWRGANGGSSGVLGSRPRPPAPLRPCTGHILPQPLGCRTGRPRT